MSVDGRTDGSFAPRRRAVFKKPLSPDHPSVYILIPISPHFFFLPLCAPSYFLQLQSQRGRERKSHTNTHMEDLKQPQTYYLNFNFDSSVFLCHYVCTAKCARAPLTAIYTNSFFLFYMCRFVELSLKGKMKYALKSRFEKNLILPFQSNKHVRHIMQKCAETMRSNINTNIIALTFCCKKWPVGFHVEESSVSWFTGEN